jgi:hypothetical protein
VRANDWRIDEAVRVAMPVRAVRRVIPVLVLMLVLITVVMRLDGPWSAEEHEMPMRADERVAMDMVAVAMQDHGVSAAHPENGSPRLHGGDGIPVRVHQPRDRARDHHALILGWQFTLGERPRKRRPRRLPPQLGERLPPSRGGIELVGP